MDFVQLPGDVQRKLLEHVRDAEQVWGLKELCHG
jgi:hypothetical protein